MLLVRGERYKMWYSNPKQSNFNNFKNNNPNPKSIFRFFLKKGEKKEIVMLDDQRFTVYEATIYVNGRWETFTSSMSPDCPLMIAAAQRLIYLNQVEYYTILDMTPYVDKNNKEKKFSKKALAIKGASREVFNRRREEASGDLKGYKIAVYRDGDKAPACGNDFQLIQKVDLSKLEAEVAKPYAFEELLKPLPNSVLEGILSRSTRGKDSDPQTFSRDAVDPFAADVPSHSEEQSAPSQTDDIPF